MARQKNPKDHIAEIGPAPCDTCPFAEVCTDGKACLEYLHWMNGETGKSRSRIAKTIRRLPTDIPTAGIFGFAFRVNGAGKPSAKQLGLEA